jgi:hypothetical protein
MGTEISPQKSVSKSGGDFDKDLLLEHLLEIRALRTKLEKSLEHIFSYKLTSSFSVLFRSSKALRRVVRTLTLFIGPSHRVVSQKLTRFELPFSI